MKLVLVWVSLLTGCVILFSFLWDTIDGELASTISWKEKQGGMPYPGEKLENIFWFIQITDLHISRYWDPNRSKDLSVFLKERLPVIDPDLILVSGDLTDAKAIDHQGSRQYEDEWQTYWNTIQNSGILRTAAWLDIRGNHDSFDVPEMDSNVNYFRKFSIKGPEHAQSYAYQVKKSFGTYNFIGVDACPDPGPKRPFNFVGYLPEDRLADLERLDKSSQGANMTVWFGHYPSSTVVVKNSGLRKILSSGIVYLCGHLHTLGNWVPQMYTYQYTGYLELELGDWKDNRIYRILAVDHDMLSFTDESFDHWPVILVTNPKHAQFQVPHHEPLDRIAKSTHIRMLIFSPWSIETVTVEVDHTPLPGVYHAGSGLFVVPWSPQQYLYGLHTITVYAKDSKGNSKEISQPFSLDGSRPHFRFWASFILMCHIDSIGMLFFMMSCLSVILPLYGLRKYPYPPKAPYLLTRGIFNWPVRYVFTRIKWIWMASKWDALYYSLTGFTIYVAIGPWFVGKLLYDHYGVVFSWGMFIKGAFIPGSIIYFYGLLQIITHNIPMLLFFGYMLDFNQRQKKGSQQHGYLSLRRDWSFMLLITFQTYMAYSGFYLAYGGMALLIGPVRTWSVIMAIALHMKCVQLSQPRELTSPMSNSHSHS